MNVSPLTKVHECLPGAVDRADAGFWCEHVEQNHGRGHNGGFGNTLADYCNSEHHLHICKESQAPRRTERRPVLMAFEPARYYT